MKNSIDHLHERKRDELDIIVRMIRDKFDVEMIVLYVFDNVPVGVCSKCGERYYRGPVLERLEELARHEELFEKRIQVPVFDFTEAAAV